MIIFIYGEDSYRAREKLKEIVEHYKKIRKGGLSLKYFDFSDKSADFSFRSFKDDMRQASIFKEKKLQILVGLFTDSDFKENFLKDAKEFLNSEDVILIYEEGEIKKSDPLLKFLIKTAKCQEFKILEGQKLKNWVKERFEKYGTTADIGAIEKIILSVGEDLWRMDNEIKKLSSFRHKGKVQSVDVEMLVKPKIDLNIFATIDAISQNNKKTALNLLHKHLEKGESPLYLLSMINYQFRNLLIVKDLSEKHIPYEVIVKKSGLHHFVVKKSYEQCRGFSLAGLKKIYQKIFQVDLDIKTGKIEPEMALDIFVAEI